MAVKLHGSNTSFNDSIKIEGDLGDLQIIEDESSGSEEVEQNVERERTFGKKVLSNNNKLPDIPNNLIQKTGPIFGKVSVTDSEHVQFGNNTYFNGPVTIKQVIQDKSGIDNVNYIETEDEIDTKEPRKGEVVENLAPKEKIWHKLTFSAVCIIVIGSIVAIVLVLQNKIGDKQDTYQQIDFDNHKTTTDLVVGSYFDILQAIIVSMILLPLIAVIVSYSLLTIESIYNGMVCRFFCGRKYKCRLCKYKHNSQINEEGDPLLIAPDHLRIVPRGDWLAQPEEGPLTKIRQPIPWVIITHTATESCSTQSECVLRVRLIQSFHIESRGWYDIGYNFLVGGDGSVYFGRGWNYEGAHTKGYNKYSVGIAFIGTFNNDPPSTQQFEACEKIIKQGVELGKLAKDYKLFGHRQLMSTLSPGEQVFNVIKTWPHFVSNVTDLKSLIPDW